MVGFIAVAILVTVTAVALVVVPLFRHRETPAPMAAVVAAVGIPAAVLLLYASFTTYPWGSLRSPGAQVSTAAAGPGGPSVDQAGAAAPNPPDLLALKQQADQHPQDLNAWLALGDGYVESDRFAEAKGAYRHAMELSSASPDAQLGLAEAEILEDRNAANGAAGDMIEAVLKQDPANPKALWYGGMVALGRGDNATVRARWGALLNMNPPEAVRHVIQQQLAMLDRGQPGMAAPAAAAPPPAAAVSGSPGLSVRVSLDAALKSRLPPNAPLFVIARVPDRPGPPVAVVRRAASDLPATIELTDQNMMVPGQTLSSLSQVRVTARISARGDPLPAPGDVYGEILWSRGASKEPLEIIMNRVVGTP